MFTQLVIYKSGKEVKDAAQARLNALEVTPDSVKPELIWQLQVLSRNAREDDRYPLTVEQLEVLGL